MNFDYVNKVNNDMNEMIFDVDYKLLNDGDNVRNATLIIKTDCFTGNFPFLKPLFTCLVALTKINMLKVNANCTKFSMIPTMTSI